MKRFDRFKKKQRKALPGGVKLMGSAVPQLVSRLGLDTSRTVFFPGYRRRRRSHRTMA